MSSGGDQAFQFATEEMGPLKLRDSMAWGRLAVLVQSQRRQRFFMVVMVLNGLGDYEKEQGEQRSNKQQSTAVLQMDVCKRFKQINALLDMYNGRNLI